MAHVLLWAEVGVISSFTPYVSKLQVAFAAYYDNNCYLSYLPLLWSFAEKEGSL